MEKKKTVFIWILLVLLAIYLVFGVYSVVMQMIFTSQTLNQNLFSIVNLALALIGLIITGIFFFKLYNMTPDIQLWVHLTFGYGVASKLILSILLIYKIGLLSMLSVVPNFIMMVFIICMWIGITMHLTRAKKENLMNFS